MKKLTLAVLASLSTLFVLAQNVGVGVTNPQEKLDVNGNVQIPGSSDYKYSSAKTRVVSVSPAAFTISAAGSTTASTGSQMFGLYRFVRGGTTGTSASMLAPVNLPDGATITGISVYVYDNDATYDVYAALYQTNATSSVLNVGTTGPTSGTPGYATLTATANSVVDNANYSYYLRFVTVENSTNLRIHGARITYTVSKAD